LARTAHRIGARSWWAPGVGLLRARIRAGVRTRIHSACIDATCITAARIDDARIHDARIHDARIDDARVHDARIHDARIHDARIHDARIHARIHDARIHARIHATIERDAVRPGVREERHVRASMQHRYPADRVEHER
jgi:hypothetical protein